MAQKNKNKHKHLELQFLYKVVRNALILSGLFFISVFAVGELSWVMCKPILVFLGSYIFTELAKHYKLSLPTNKKGVTSYNTLVY